MSNFAIKGHSTRGKEILEILQMLGGINKYNITYTEDNLWYCLRYKDNVIIATYPNSSIKTVLSIEELLEKFPYKLNDPVLCDNGLLGIITKMEWDCEKSDMRYHISFNTPLYNKWYYSKNIKCKFMDEKDKKLAIKGHSTRGKEVIEILKMLGGKDVGYNGVGSSYYYYINDYDNIIGVAGLEDSEKFVVYSLEQFLEKFPYKVGDRVIDTSEVFHIIGMKWDCRRNIVIYTMQSNDSIINCYDSTWIKPYKEETMESKPNLLQQLKEYFDNTPRDVIEKEWNELSYLNEIGPTVDEYLELVKKYRQSNQYPKTYEECCDVLEIKYSSYCVGYQEELLDNFQQLIVCRDAYWKIYGERMGLGKPWEPDWNNLSTTHEFIKINKGCFTYSSRVLVFPTEEMRDTFFNNFNELIESCKELL